MPSSAVSCPATRCGSMSKRSTMPLRRTAGAAPRSRCGCPAWKSCAPRPARRRMPSRARLIRWRRRELQEALARLDPEATRQALQRLAEAQQELRRELERSQELFKRAALEGELASLAKDAEDLQRRQAEWNKDQAQHPDSAAAAAERDLATATDSLARGVERAGQTVPLQQSQAAARRAQGAMQEAANAASQRDSRGARASGQEAAEEGTHAIEQEIDAAAGRHALVSPQLEAALGYAQNQMKQAREQLEQGDPSPATAAPFAEQALDALNATAHALVRTAERVAGAQSGSGFQEALEQLARMAQQQQGMNGDAQGCSR